jgi:RimJ/RimL family protein N-acetyltransferase
MTALATAPHSPHTLHVETLNYVIRSLQPGDATENWCDWLAEPVAQRMLNAKPQRLTMEQLRGYIARFDGLTSHLLGIFEKDGGRLVGIRAIYIDPVHKEYSVNMLVGESDARGKGARRETRHAMHDLMFNTLGMEAGRCSVLAHNTGMIETLHRNGWIHEHTSRKPSADGSGFVELLHFRLLRDSWNATQADRALREQNGV